LHSEPNLNPSHIPPLPHPPFPSPLFPTPCPPTPAHQPTQLTEPHQDVIGRLGGPHGESDPEAGDDAQHGQHDEELGPEEPQQPAASASLQGALLGGGVGGEDDHFGARVVGHLALVEQERGEGVPGGKV
jgi:hypothetical protein